MASTTQHRHTAALTAVSRGILKSNKGAIWQYKDPSRLSTYATTVVTAYTHLVSSPPYL